MRCRPPRAHKQGDLNSAGFHMESASVSEDRGKGLIFLVNEITED